MFQLHAKKLNTTNIHESKLEIEKKSALVMQVASSAYAKSMNNEFAK
jgi:hypothetical protein